MFDSPPIQMFIMSAFVLKKLAANRPESSPPNNPLCSFFLSSLNELFQKSDIESPSHASWDCNGEEWLDRLMTSFVIHLTNYPICVK